MTRVRAPMWLNNGSTHQSGLASARCWLVRSKLWVGFSGSGEGLDQWIPREEGTAWGWFHRAAYTSRSRQWKDSELGALSSHIAWWAEHPLNNHFLHFAVTWWGCPCFAYSHALSIKQYGWGDLHKILSSMIHSQ